MTSVLKRQREMRQIGVEREGNVKTVAETILKQPQNTEC